METERKVFTLTELTRSLRSVIERTYSGSYWVKAEIAKLNHYPRSGHCYPDLVDKVGDQVMAQMRAIIWAGDFRSINKQFLDVTGEPIGEGMAILFQTSVTFHPVHGLSLLIHHIEPSFTLGQMALEKQKNLERLQKEGIYDRNRKLPMAMLPRRLAIISVETSKGYTDFQQILKAYPRYGIWYYLFPALLQGDKAVEAIIGQLRRLRNFTSHFDMVAIIRGGGGDVGLNAYDHYNLAREIALFPLPVITGIGHATNLTLAEMVAWENKITPTDVAYFVVNRFLEFDQRVQKARQLIFPRALNLLEQQQQVLMRKANLLKSFSVKALNKERQRLQYLQASVSQGSQRFLSQKSRNLEHMQGKLRLLDPATILKRGYSITLYQGKSLKTTQPLRPGQLLTTRLYQGSFQSIVNSKDNDL